MPYSSTRAMVLGISSERLRAGRSLPGATAWRLVWLSLAIVFAGAALGAHDHASLAEAALDRALLASWCGETAHSGGTLTLLGHCAWCYLSLVSGAIALLGPLARRASLHGRAA